MTWYEILNAILLTSCIFGCLFYIRKEKIVQKFPIKTICDNDTFKVLKVMINCIMLIQFYYFLALYAWIKHRQITVTIDPSDFLYVIAELAKNIFFILIVLYSLKWINEKICYIKKVMGEKTKNV